MSLSDLAAIGNIVAAMAVVFSLIYLSRQVRHANLLARSQVRQRMVEQAHEELYVLMNNPDLREAWLPETKLSAEAQSKLAFFLAAAMRQREWEWYQYKDGLINQDVYCAYYEVIAFHLGAERTRNWWATVGRLGFNPEFVSEVDSFMKGRPLTYQYFEKIRTFDPANCRPGSEKIRGQSAPAEASKLRP